MQDFANKLILCQEYDVQITINMVMVPEWFERDWENALFFHEQGINVTLKPQSDPTASRVVDGYKQEDLKRLSGSSTSEWPPDTSRAFASFCVDLSTAPIVIKMILNALMMNYKQKSMTHFME